MVDKAAGQQGTPLNSDELNGRFFDIDARIAALESGSLATAGLVEDTLAAGLRGIQDAMALITGGGVPVNGSSGQVLMWAGALYLWRNLSASDISDLAALLAAKVGSVSPNFTGAVDMHAATSVSVPVPGDSDSSGRAAPTSWVQARIAQLVGAAPSNLDTLAELAAALAGNASFSATVLAAIAQSTESARGTMALASDATVRTGTNRTNAVTPGSLQSRFATTAQYLADEGGLILSTDAVNSGGTFHALVDASTIAIDFSQGVNFSVTLGGSRTLGNPSNVVIGRSGVISVKQPASGGPRTLAFGSYWQGAGHQFPTLSVAANAEDLIYYWAKAANAVVITGCLKAVS